MNSMMYAYHDAYRAMMNLVRIQTQISAQQMESSIIMMRPFFAPFFSYMEQLEKAPAKITLKDFFRTAAAMNLALREFADRLPDNVTLHYGANKAKGNHNLPLSGKDSNHLHIHFNMTEPHKNMQAMAEVLDILSRDYEKPDFRIKSASINGESVPVRVARVMERDFVDLLHFDTGREDAPKILLGAPMSGHYSTLVRDKVQSYLNAGFDVYVVDINNTKNIPASKGKLGLDGLAERYIDFMKHIGPGVHVDATCQATSPTLIASTWLAQNEPEYKPASLTLVAGPVNPHAAPTEVSNLACFRPIEWFRDNMLTRVPDWYKGAGRNVLAGFMQLTSFMGMNPDKHAHSFGRIYNHIVADAQDGIIGDREFREEYHAVSDLDADFYLETVDRIFMRNDLAGGRYEFRGDRLDLANLRDIPIFTVEGEKDDICAPGQTLYAHKLIRPEYGRHIEVPGRGHYGAFSGSGAREYAVNGAIKFIHEITGGSFTLLNDKGEPMTAPPEIVEYSDALLEKTIARSVDAFEDSRAARAKQDKIRPGIEIEFPAIGFKMAA